MTPLLLSAREYPELAQVLIANGADVRVADSAGVTALHLTQSIPFAALLIDNGAQVSVIDAFGDTPLSNAIVGGYGDLADLLVQKGAQIDSKFADAHNPLYLTMMRRDTALAKRLITRG